MRNIMRQSIIGFFALLILSVASAPLLGQSAAKEESKEVTNKKCPITGTDVSAKVRAEYKGQYVYFCCDGCPAEFNKEPEKYVAKLSKEDQEAIKINSECPVSHEPINKSLFVE